MPQSADNHLNALARSPLVRWLAILQGVYYLLTGVWPLLHYPSFEAVTGPKVDVWLVKTVGVLIIAIAAPLLLAGLRRRVTWELWLLAVGSAAGLTAIDIYYVLTDVIDEIYLADAVAEVVLIGLWIFAAVRGRAR